MDSQNMWHWLMSLDAPTRAAIIGGLATLLAVLGALLGVYLNLTWNRKQHRDEKSYNLRKDVYLHAITIINRAAGFLLVEAIPGPTKKEPDDKPDISEDLSGACASVYLLGGKRVVAAVIAFESAFRHWSNTFKARQRMFRELRDRQKERIEELEQLTEIGLALLRDVTPAKQESPQFDVASSDQGAPRKALNAGAESDKTQAKLADIEKMPTTREEAKEILEKCAAKLDPKMRTKALNVAAEWNELLAKRVEIGKQLVQAAQELEAASSDPEVRKKALNAVTEWKDVEVKLDGKAASMKEQLDSIQTAMAKAQIEPYQELATGVDYLLKIQTDLAPLLHEVTLAMKSDLGVPSDERWYKDKMEVVTKMEQRALKDLVETHAAVKRARAEVKAAERSG